MLNQVHQFLRFNGQSGFCNAYGSAKNVEIYPQNPFFQWRLAIQENLWIPETNKQSFSGTGDAFDSSQAMNELREEL